MKRFRFLVIVSVLVSLFVFTGGTGVAIINGVTAQSAVSCTANPTTVTPGEPVSLNASNSDATFVEFDINGDGTYERADDTDFIIEVSYNDTGSYEPVVRGDSNDNATASCGEVTVDGSNDPPTASLTIYPNPATVDNAVTFDAAESSDSDGTIVEHQWDFDGDDEVDRISATATIEHTYSTAGTFNPTVTVVDDSGDTGVDAVTEFTVQSQAEDDAQDGESQDGESQDGESQDGESNEDETENNQSPEDLTVGWPQKGDDPQNTGYDASELAPTANPSEAWATENINQIERSSPVVVDGSVYIGAAGVGTERPFFYSYDAESGDINWFFEAEDGASTFDTTPVVSDGRVYAGTEDGRMYIRDAETGDSAGDQFPLYFTAGQAEISVENPTVADGTLYFGTGDGEVHAYDASGGAIQWTFELEGDSTEVAATPTVADGTVYFSTSGLGNQRVYAVNADSGSTEWQYTLGDTGTSPGGATQVTFNDGQVYLGTEDLDSNAPNKGEDVYAFDADSGNIEWTKSLEGDYVGSGKTGLAAAGEGVFVAAQPGTVYALDADSGETVWEASTAGEITVQPSIANQVLYIGDNSGQVYALNTSTGEQKWGALAAQSGIAASPTPADGALYVPTGGDGLIKYTGDVADQRSNAVIDIDASASDSDDSEGMDGTGDDDTEQSGDESTASSDSGDGGDSSSDDGSTDGAESSSGDGGDSGNDDVDVEVNTESDSSVEIPGMGVTSAVLAILTGLYIAKYRN